PLFASGGTLVGSGTAGRSSFFGLVSFGVFTTFGGESLPLVTPPPPVPFKSWFAPDGARVETGSGAGPLAGPDGGAAWLPPTVPPPECSPPAPGRLTLGPAAP